MKLTLTESTMGWINGSEIVAEEYVNDRGLKLTENWIKSTVAQQIHDYSPAVLNSREEAGRQRFKIYYRNIGYT